MVRENGGNRFSFSSGEKAGMREISKSGLGWRSAIGQGDANWGRNRVAVEAGFGAITQGSSPGSQPWALGRNPFGILTSDGYQGERESVAAFLKKKVVGSAGLVSELKKCAR